ncbi:807_t:CDS:2 [Paraglomus occultum]|uniref:807_t:CDS:1 n=1 Tax=Paraglomus occultum TaxID=144539 RepID=A0A9N9G5X7_9GLOM|nr:807_t:CDS:2 [Paraglomus occultum]
MPNKWNDYFDKVQPKDYSFIGYYEHRSKQTDFTFSFQKESYELKADFDNLMEHEGALIVTATTECCLPYGRNVRYEKMDTLTTTGTSECCLPYGRNVEAISPLINITKETFATIIGNVHSAVENVNDTLRLTGGGSVIATNKKRAHGATSASVTEESAKRLKIRAIRQDVV